MDIDKEFDLIFLWVHNNIRRMCLNAFIDSSKVGLHSLYTFIEFKNAIYDVWTGETVVEREKQMILWEP